MTVTGSEVERRFQRFVEHHVLHGTRLPMEQLCGDRPDLAIPLETLIDRYLSLTDALAPIGLEDIDGTRESGFGIRPGAPSGPDESRSPGPESRRGASRLPTFDGFQTIERIGFGGMGEVFKLRDLRLDRVVAAKVVRGDRQGPWRAGLEDFLREARALALFSDRRIVQIFDARPDADPPVIIMEDVDGFELGRMAPSLEFAQRARIMVQICEAIHHAHGLGLQHRDLKPSNIMLDAQLQPRILDFGLSAGDPRRGHLKGTLPYVAPEQLDPARLIDARTDVYALGIIFYEMLCGQAPYAGDDARIVDAIHRGQPKLPVEVDPRVPEPLQAVALKAMEADPAQRYTGAEDMAADLRRYLAGGTVLARPSVDATTLGSRIKVHMDQVGEWLRARLIYPHEAERLRAAYRTLEAREDDWIVASRVLSYTQIALYLGAFLVVCGSLFYFYADRWGYAVTGLAQPFMVLGLPFIGLNAAAHLLYSRDHKAVAVAFYLAAVALLPLFLLILFHEAHLLVVAKDTPGQLFLNGSVSNRQLQITTFAACAWCGFLALRTRTAALSTAFTILGLLLALATVSDLGLRTWVDQGEWDKLSLHLLPLVVVYGALGAGAEQSDRPWLSRPAYLGSAMLLVLLLELLALNGRAFSYLGISLKPYQSAKVGDPLLLDTIAAMTLNGIVFYAAATALARRRSDHVRTAAQFLLVISPFSLLHPLGYLVRTAEYSLRWDWIYAALAITIVLLSQVRQRRAFYYAGIINLGAALFDIASHREWFSRPAWAITLVIAGLLALGAGFALDWKERRRGLA